jgi:SAM-dependent MidA family methyltransferase
MLKTLAQVLRRDIDKQGAISLARFMDLALYCPELGYYDRLVNTAGREGDFYTSVSAGSLLGELLAFQFARWLEPASSDGCQLVEAGAHDGRLAADILTWLQSRRPEVFNRLEYWILEPSERRRPLQQQTLAGFAPRVQWFDSWPRWPRTPVRGVIFSNELLDAMPVHRLVWDAANQTWFERGVGWEQDRFVWRRLERPVLAPSFFPRLSPELLAALPDGFATEVSPAAVQWWGQASLALGEGRLLTLDYGLREEQFFVPERGRGTLRAYYKHRLSEEVLDRVGEQDLTAHVNFTAVQKAGETAGLKSEALLTQEQFLTRLAEATWQDASVFGDWTTARVRQFQSLTHPEHLGAKFKVLIQTR